MTPVVSASASPPARLRPRSPGEWVGLVAACLACPYGAWCVPLAWCPPGAIRTFVERLHALCAGAPPRPTVDLADEAATEASYAAWTAARTAALTRLGTALTPAERALIRQVQACVAAVPTIERDGIFRRWGLWEWAVRRAGDRARLTGAAAQGLRLYGGAAPVPPPAEAA